MKINEQLRPRSDLAESDQIEEERIPAEVNEHLTALGNLIRMFEDEVRSGNSEGAHAAIASMEKGVKALRSSIPS